MKKYLSIALLTGALLMSGCGDSENFVFTNNTNVQVAPVCVDDAYTTNQDTTLTVNATNIANNDPGDDFAIGRGNGQGGQQELLHWDGGVNNFIGMQSSFGATDLNSYYQSIGEEFSEQSWYSDLTSFAGLGEDPYPTVVDTLGALTGGELVNGTEEDFVPIE